MDCHWLDPRSWPRPGSKRAWAIPLGLGVLAAAMLLLSPWRAAVRSEVLHQLPEGMSEDQVIVSRAFRHSILTGIGPDALSTARSHSTRLYDFQLFERVHLIARLKPGQDILDAQKEMRAIFLDSTVRVFPVRRIVMGDTHMLVIIWLIGWCVVLAHAFVELARNPAWWRFRLYEVSTLAGIGAVLILLFANVGEALGAGRPLAPPAWLFWAWGFVYIALTGVLLWTWCLDIRTRCRICARALHLPMEMGDESSIVLDTPRIELVCFEGHGALTMDRWHDDWRGYRDMWEAFSRPCQ